jgi:hypothetical protein
MIVGLPGDTDARVELLSLAPSLEALRTSGPAVGAYPGGWAPESRPLALGRYGNLTVLGGRVHSRRER